MTDPGTTRTRRGAHRARREILRILVAPLLALAVVGAMITGLVVWLGGSSGGRQDLAVATPSPTASVPAQQSAPSEPTGAATSAPTIPVAPSPTRPANVAAPTVTAAAAPTASAAAPPTATAEPVRAAKSMRIVILNQTGRTGLAAVVAGRLRSAGWLVAGVGNFRGSVAGTTVYYPPGERAAAVALAQTLRGPDRVRPRFGNLSNARLTVVLAGDYPG